MSESLGIGSAFDVPRLQEWADYPRLVLVVLCHGEQRAFNHADDLGSITLNPKP